MDHVEYISLLGRLGACQLATEVALHGRHTLRSSWDTCVKGSWLLWLAGRVDCDHRLLVKAARACVRTDAYADALAAVDSWLDGTVVTHGRAFVLRETLMVSYLSTDSAYTRSVICRVNYLVATLHHPSAAFKVVNPDLDSEAASIVRSIIPLEALNV